MWTDRTARRTFWTGVALLVVGVAGVVLAWATARGREVPDREEWIMVFGVVGVPLMVAGSALMIVAGWKDVRARRAAKRAAERSSFLRDAFS